MGASPSSGRCKHQKSPDSFDPKLLRPRPAALFVSLSFPPACLKPARLPRQETAADAFGNVQLVGNILDQTKGSSRWDSDTDRAPLCEKPQGESLTDAGTGQSERRVWGRGGVASAAETRLFPLRLIGRRDDWRC